MSKNKFELWLPPEESNDDSKNHDLYLKWALKNITNLERNDFKNTVDNLIKIGFYYHAARCLEIYSQNNIGVFFDGSEILNHRNENFGTFHNDISFLLEAGNNYLLAKRKKTAENTFNRALSFVEESIRQVESFENDCSFDILCLAIAFELAGHCCFTLNNKNGIDYYEAAEKYWQKSYEINYDEAEVWKSNNATKIVINCLKQVAKIKLTEDTSIITLLSNDYKTRLKKAKELI